MIKVNLEKENNDFKKITIKGHAKYDDFGKDIVCSAASSIVITTVNAILMFDKNAIEHSYNDDTLSIEIKKNDKITSNLINNMINLLKELESNYPKNIKIL
ncbi:MAG: ribosomal-processing cysteine protease Prp [bacterium]|nr:ribosomal-processing cysteine protease Prp [bacterium]